MNKKISTLFTAGLLVAGSLFSSAWAEELKIAADPTKWANVDTEKQYILASPAWFNGTEFSTDSHDFYVIAYKNTENETKIGIGPKEKGELIVWDVTAQLNSSGVMDYSFSSSFGDLSVTYKVMENEKEVEKTQTAFQKGNDAPNSSAALKWMVSASLQYEIGATQSDVNGVYNLAAQTTGLSNSTQSFALYEVFNTNPGEELNELYNNKGFSFVLDDEDGEIENIFNQRIVALDVDEEVLAVENQQVDKENWGFPAGTYFTVSRPEGDWKTMTTAAEKYGYLKGCTFIAISSTESIEMTDADRKVGKGFDLITISGEDLYKYLGSDKTITPRNQQVSVYNAAFKVTKAATGEYSYAINAENFYFLQADDAEGEDAIHKIAKVSINTIEHNKVTYLTTDPANGVNKIFKFGEAGIVEGIDLLKTDGPAVYNIKFVSGDNDKTELNKYLTIGQKPGDDGAWAFFAKGKALSQNVLNTPAYQFIITGVDDENNITFTNRESGESFKAKLYTEEGDARSLAIADDSKNKSFYIANINTSSYGVTVVEDDVDFDDVEIELEESTVVPFAGFCDAEDGTTVTMGFSKDAYNTSNILYAVVGNDDNEYALDGKELSDDIYDAAQFQLKKVEEDGVAKIMRDYIYDNGNDGIAVEAWGDTVYIQKYTMEYIEDLENSKKFLTYDKNGAKLDALYTEETKIDLQQYVIRENADGSVEIMTQNAVEIGDDENGKLLVESMSLAIKGEKDPYTYGYVDAYKIAEEATTIKTYLLDRPIYQSWEKEGHVSLQSEVGNYLSMNEAYDGVLLNDAPDAYFLYMTDTAALVPSFYITMGMESENGERLFLFNAVDSADYQMTGDFDPKYKWNKNDYKVIFKPAIINETRDTLALTVKGEVEKLVANEENNETNVWGGLNRFKWQIIETGDGDDTYYIRQAEQNEDKVGAKKYYLMNKNEKLTWGTKDEALKFRIANVEGPVANETIADEAEGVQVIAGNGAVTIQGAAGKTVVITNILGKAVANTTLTSDNQTINVPAGIVVVTVDGEAVKAIVK